MTLRSIVFTKTVFHEIVTKLNTSCINLSLASIHVTKSVYYFLVIDNQV